MLLEPTKQKLRKLKLIGMLESLEQQMELQEVEKLSFEDRLGLLLDQEILKKENQKVYRLLKQAGLKQDACIEDLEFPATRKLSKQMILSLASCQWIKQGHNLMITGATGTGKTYLACALGKEACHKGFSVKYSRPSRLFPELFISRGDGSYLRKLEKIGRAHV